ncbi:N-acetylglucosaminyl deacetylase, LmbE family [Pseudoxanthomonas sp. GM95]|uniref:PIG-L deacetylase family protein n=1 Tax=Pseudoxanthomonas sp. GM95 TaxID=1881043 RepID=UPI0008D0C75D|nr:PIG-L deacetylase family protein [Pseudoxanthomonas sp. GM95]SEL18046.1 N-acetylglucosaminyl deacetylase, LmbE family [Pseudoxanthomonas sp. GM95]
MEALKGRSIQGTGNTEEAWASSTLLRDLPETDLAGLLGDSARLVVVAPHPDDEVLGCGGLIAAAIHSGLQVLVVSLTDGEAAYACDPAWPPQRLAPIRRSELLNAVRALGGGTDNIAHVGIADGHIAVCIERAIDALAQVRRRDTVLVTWAKDGHPDHEAAAQAAQQVCARVGARLIQYPIWCWHWADPERADFLSNRARRFLLSASVQARKRAALLAFATQIGTSVPRPASPILPPHVLARFQRPYEVYLT